MKKIFFLIALCCLSFAGLHAAKPSKQDSVIEQQVREAVESKNYQIRVEEIFPPINGERYLTGIYLLKIYNDSAYTQLPYFGTFHITPVGFDAYGLWFANKYSDYKAEIKKDHYYVFFRIKNGMEQYDAYIYIYFDGSVQLSFNSSYRSGIRYSGHLILPKE